MTLTNRGLHLSNFSNPVAFTERADGSPSLRVEYCNIESIEIKTKLLTLLKMVLELIFCQY